ncbi:AAA ATPase domain-containing protein [Promicromonospora umidemergens]|uniref:ATP-binding protein n=1 Tax=Promicromonospora umidemergens TaxID=629679 RepID=A0ABP8WUM9_9MICO|nr:ATP-binding protein [Promicromonospora umidemergens]MCP2283491.1 AAA ATPase domain-containing protein [Promicromonospora umidemergens]
MTTRRNPFKPTAGATPPLLVGRHDDLDEFEESLDDGPGAPGRLTIFTGARGVGKTVMLTEVSDRALRRGWVTIADAALPGLIDRLTDEVTDHLHELDPSRLPGRDLTGLSIGGSGVTFSERQVARPRWRKQLGALLDALEQNETGLLLTVDEVHSSAREELRQLAATYQLLVREDRNIALAFAGLPAAVSDLLNDDVLTFLRRANQVELKDVALDDVRTALRSTVRENGREITEPALDHAAQATGGYPFMIQLVGYHVWRKATGDLIDEESVLEAIPVARRRLGATVHATALADLSDVDRTYLLAMSQDDGESSTGELARRIGASSQHAGVYRARLIAAGMIEPTRHGHVDFALPFLREYLREHAAQYRIDDHGKISRRDRRS